MNTNQKTWTQSLWYWRLAIFECLTDAFIAGSMVWISAVANQDWEQLPHTAKVTIELCTVVAMLKVIKSFLSTTIAMLQDSMPLPEGVGSRQEIKETVKTTIDNPPVPAKDVALTETTKSP